MVFRVVSLMSCGFPIVASMVERIRRDISLAKNIALVKRQVMKARTCVGFLAAVDNNVDRCVNTAFIAVMFLFR